MRMSRDAPTRGGIAYWLAVALVALAVVGWIVSGPSRGFAFTPLWSSAFAAWFLLTLTLALHGLAKVQGGDGDAQRQLGEARAASTAAREAAVTAETNARTSVGGAAAGQPPAQPAAQPAAEPAAEPAAQPLAAAAPSPDQAEVDAARENAVAAASAVAAATVRARRAGLKSLIIGADGRASTSKAGALVWTYAVLFVLAYMLVVGRTPWLAEGTPHLPKFHTALADFIAAPFQPEYFALLGFPVAAAVTAKALTTNKVVQGQVDKSKGQNTGVASGLSELISNDSGQSDLLDFQYLAFNLFTLAYFFVSFATSAATNPKAGLPAIPATLLALSGVSAAGYLTKKAVESGVAPTITAVAPLRVVLNEDTALEIDGGGFLGGGNSVSPSNLVLLDGKVLPVRKQDWEDTHVVAQLPKGTADELTRLGWRDRGPDNPALVVVRDDSGNSSPAVQVEIALPKPAPAHRP